MTGKIYDVFVSYAHSDADVAGKVFSALEAAGLVCFIDNEGIAGGDNWLTVLAKAIQQSRVFLPLISRAFFRSDYSCGELQVALMERKRGNMAVLPYLIDEGVDETMPAEMKLLLSPIQWITRRDCPVGPLLVTAVKSSMTGSFIQKTSLSETPRVLESHCYYHPDRGVAAQCIDCRKNLCKDCASRYRPENGGTIPICSDCANRRNAAIDSQKAEQFREEKSAWNKKLFIFLLKLVFTLAGIIFIASQQDKNAFWLLPLCFIPFGLRVAAAADEDPYYRKNVGCFVMIIFAAIGGVIIFILDIIDLISSSPKRERVADSGKDTFPKNNSKDVTSSYVPLIILFSVVIVIAVLLFLWIRK